MRCLLAAHLFYLRSCYNKAIGKPAERIMLQHRQEKRRYVVFVLGIFTQNEIFGVVFVENQFYHRLPVCRGFIKMEGLI